MLTASRNRARKAVPVVRGPSAPIPAPVPHPAEQAEKIRQLELEASGLRVKLVAAERRAALAEERLKLANAAATPEPADEGPAIANPKAPPRGKR